MNKPLRLSTIALLLVLSGCGWQLRGSGGETTIARLHLTSSASNSVFARTLENYLQSNGTELVDSASEAEYSLKIIKQKSKRRTATINASARISERLLEEKVEYLVTRSDGSIAIENSTASVERIYEYNEDNVLATEDEAQLLKNEMYSDLARQITNRLRHLKKPVADSTTSTSAP